MKIVRNTKDIMVLWFLTAMTLIFTLGCLNFYSLKLPNQTLSVYFSVFVYLLISEYFRYFRPLLNLKRFYPDTGNDCDCPNCQKRRFFNHIFQLEKIQETINSACLKAGAKPNIRARILDTESPIPLAHFNSHGFGDPGYIGVGVVFCLPFQNFTNNIIFHEVYHATEGTLMIKRFLSTFRKIFVFSAFFFLFLLATRLHTDDKTMLINLIVMNFIAGLILAPLLISYTC